MELTTEQANTDEHLIVVSELIQRLLCYSKAAAYS